MSHACPFLCGAVSPRQQRFVGTYSSTIVGKELSASARQTHKEKAFVGRCSAASPKRHPLGVNLVCLGEADPQGKGSFVEQ